MTFIYEHDPYCLEICRMCKYELLTSRLSKVIIWQTYRQTSYSWSLPVTWHRWRSHRSIHSSRKPHDTRKHRGFICYRIEDIGGRRLHCRNRHFGRFRLLWPWPLSDDLHTRTWPILPAGCANMNFLRQGFRKLSSDRQTDRQTDNVIHNRPKW